MIYAKLLIARLNKCNLDISRMSTFICKHMLVLARHQFTPFIIFFHNFLKQDVNGVVVVKYIFIKPRFLFTTNVSAVSTN